MKIIAMGDFHAEGFENIKKLVESEKPDIIVSFGDYSNIADFSFSERSALIELYEQNIMDLLSVKNLNEVRRCIKKDQSNIQKLFPYFKKALQNPETYEITRKQMREAFQTLHSLDIPVLVLPGNQDKLNIYRQEVSKFNNLKDIHGTYYSKDNIIFIGYGGTPKTPFGFPFEFNENEAIIEISKMLDRALLYGGRVMITHSPPKGFCDLSKGRHPSSEGRHLGSEAIKHIYEEIKPLALICGHVHEAIGKKDNVLNAGEFRRGSYGILEVNEWVKNLELKNYLKTS